ncbi:MAG: phosphoglycolate phosphatase [Hyphomicrobiaceae bacterium]
MPEPRLDANFDPYLGDATLKAVIFDLDGTLVDSAAAICANANELMAELGCPPLDVKEAQSYIGHGARRFLEQALAVREGAYDAATFETRMERFYEIYGAAPPDANPPYPGVEEVLRTLHDRDGVALGMCTNKPGVPTKTIIDAYGWTDLFGAVLPGDALAERKPHPLPLLTAVERLGASSAVYIGDSEVDAATAEAAKIPFILFTEGYRKTPVAEIKADAVFSDHADLLAIIDRF